MNDESAEIPGERLDLYGVAGHFCGMPPKRFAGYAKSHRQASGTRRRPWPR